MNAKGAKRWMYHMKNALRKNYHHFSADPRILPCIVDDFLKTKMKSYAKTHCWEFDESDFDLAEFYPLMKREEGENPSSIVDQGEENEQQ